MKRTHPSDDLPLAWSLFSSWTIVDSLGPETLLRAIERGDFSGTLDGVDEAGNSIIGAFLRSSSSMSFRSSRWMNSKKQQLPMLRALLANGADPWCVDDEGFSAFDRMFQQGIDQLLVELAPQDPHGKDAWKTRIHEYSGERLPWLHSVVRHSQTAVLDLKLLSQLPGVDFNQQDDQGNSPLFHANSREVVGFLLANGADPSHRNHVNDGVVAAWSTRNIPSTRLMAMKKMLLEYGMKSSREQEVSDFMELAKTAASSVLIPIYKDLALDDVLPQLLEKAVDRLLSCGQNYRREIRASWGWLDFLVARPGGLEAVDEKVMAELAFLAHGECSREQDSNLTARLRVREQMQLRRPVDVIQSWRGVDKSRFDGSKYNYAATCLEYFQNQIKTLANAAADAGQREDLSGLWYAIELRDELPNLAPTSAAAWGAASRKLLPWCQPGNSCLDQHPRAWTLLLSRSGVFSDDEFDTAVHHLVSMSTPLPNATIPVTASLNPKRQASMERAIYLNMTPQAQSSRPSRRF